MQIFWYLIEVASILNCTFQYRKSASWSWLSGINNLATCQMIPIIANTYIGQKVIRQWKKLIFTAQFHLLYMKSLQKLNRLVEKTENTWYRYLIYIRDTDGRQFSLEARIDSTWQVATEHTCTITCFISLLSTARPMAWVPRLILHCLWGWGWGNTGLSRRQKHWTHNLHWDVLQTSFLSWGKMRLIYWGNLRFPNFSG